MMLRCPEGRHTSRTVGEYEREYMDLSFPFAFLGRAMSSKLEIHTSTLSSSSTCGALEGLRELYQPTVSNFDFT
jgi:hypothetical protein